MGESASNSHDDLTARDFTRLHTEVAPQLWAWASVHLGAALRASVDPEDVLQEISCRAWRRFDEFDPDRGSFLAWSFGIARNVLGELLRRIARGEGDRARWSTDSWSRIPDDATRATARVARAEHLAQFVVWADGLDEKDRQLVLYRGLEGWSHARVAEMIGLTENATQKRWMDLRERLRGQPRVIALLAPDQGE